MRPDREGVTTTGPSTWRTGLGPKVAQAKLVQELYAEHTPEWRVRPFSP